MFRYRLSLSYDGSSFKGWQIQPNAPSVQDVLQKTLQIVIGEKVSVVGAGRTDAGVHAACQIAHFETVFSLPSRFLETTNQLLPPTIRILSIERIGAHFHARFSAREKTYHYRMTTASSLHPFHARYCTLLAGGLDREKIQNALKFFVGTHDFSSFTNALKPIRCPIKTIYSITYIPENNQCFCLEFKGNGFLYKMVRNIVGTLIYVGKNKIPWNSIPSLLHAKDRRHVPPPAPAQGLFLVSVSY